MGERAPASAVERAFERKVRLSQWALLFEQVWPRAWLALGLAGVFIGASLAGLWPRLPELPHKIVLGLFGLAFAIALVALVKVRWPSREQAIRRVETISGVQHRPASSYEDTLTLGAADVRTAALWRAHRQRLAALLAKLRVGHPSPRTDRYDPFALRALLLLSVFVLLIVVGDSASDRLRSAFRFGALAKGAEARIDAWVTPPAYTGRAPIMLADGGYSALRPQERPAGPFEVPDRSVLVVRATGAALGALTMDAPGSEGSRQQLEAPAPASASDVSEIKLEVRHPMWCAHHRGPLADHGIGKPHAIGRRAILYLLLHVAHAARTRPAPFPRTSASSYSAAAIARSSAARSSLAVSSVSSIPARAPGGRPVLMKSSAITSPSGA